MRQAPLTTTSFAAATRGLPFLLRRLLAIALRIEAGRLEIVAPDGRVLAFGGTRPGPDARMTIADARLASRVFLKGEIGFAQAYCDGLFDTPDLGALLTLFAINRKESESVVSEPLPLRLWRRLREATRRNTRTGARRNIADHYDLGEAFYAAWLDPTMTYSSGVYATGARSLEEAQAEKHRLLAQATGIGPGDHVLEIGCGWGSFALYAAREIGCRVTALTISRAQHEHAARTIAQAGLSDLIELRFEDYRDVGGTYDRIVSIEMFEAVGEAYWDAFYETMKARLAPGGRAGLQLITIRDTRYEAYRGRVDFIRRHVFPGGMLPSDAVVARLSERHGMPIVSDASYAEDYALTLRAWRGRFAEAWPRIAPLGFDERFRRMWTYYLAYCEVGFATRNTDVRQIVLARP
ncbi:SAM-dependent methyltransferase [Salinarimonas ramus]|uniref:Cyclopropane-fatty-acyl-phospholipid synthase n=1 Tax=Salinarimonas ramus TaxID=690164 RepID=A0A917QL97_9HYPH|nr:cyclopropane-fatty-acyl-phospholipid synthase family protein [Salinarimonas ramus]GGK54527.1 cyclopropane-fatty-acyl-phospholipid synthase [Salinarimonas ramus]